MAENNVRISPIDRMNTKSGMGTCCAESQADGVPCPIIMPDCGICELGRAQQEQLSVALLPKRDAPRP